MIITGIEHATVTGGGAPTSAAGLVGRGDPPPGMTHRHDRVVR